MYVAMAEYIKASQKTGSKASLEDKECTSRNMLIQKVARHLSFVWLRRLKNSSGHQKKGRGVGSKAFHWGFVMATYITTLPFLSEGLNWKD